MADQLAAQIVKLERVLIVGKRVNAQAQPQLAQLPGLFIEGRRAVLQFACMRW